MTFCSCLMVTDAEMECMLKNYKQEQRKRLEGAAQEEGKQRNGVDGNLMTLQRGSVDSIVLDTEIDMNIT